MEYSEEELLPIAALQHLAFCERQWGLIYLENAWAENERTVKGGLLHERVHNEGWESRGSVRLARAVRVRSLMLGLVGVIDLVELYPDAKGTSFAGVSGKWRPVPVEYKRGKPKAGICDVVQVVAQALCLEEMLATPVNEAGLFYGTTRRRLPVKVDAELRHQTKLLIARLHEMTRLAVTPPPEPGPHCRACSLRNQCCPELARRRSVRTYLTELISEVKGKRK